MAAAAGASLIDRAGEPCLLPRPPTSSPAGGEHSHRKDGQRSGPGPGWGRELRWRPELDLVLEALETGASGGPRVLALDCSNGSGAKTAFELLARESRLRGFVPVTTAALSRYAGGAGAGSATALTRLLHDRHLLVFHDGRRGQEPSNMCSRRAALVRLLAVMAKAGRPHLVLVARSGRCEPCIHLPSIIEVRGRRALPAAAWSGAASVAAESAEPYVAETVTRPVVLECPHGVGLALGQVQAGRDLIRRGRHASGERLMRRALGALERRQESAHAGWTALSLGDLTLHRGRTSEAAVLFERARAAFERAGITAGALSAAIALGLAQTDAGDLVVAEATLRTALAGADALDEHGQARLARVALARCLLWQQRIDEARRELDRATPALGEDLGSGGAPPAPTQVSEDAGANVGGRLLLQAEPDIIVISSALACRIALAQGAPEPASAAAGHALLRATCTGQALDQVIAERAMAAVQAALGDAAALRARVERGLCAARAIRRPLQGLRLRLTLVDGLLRTGNCVEARRLMRLLARFDVRGVPGLLRDRLREVRKRCDAPATVAAGRGTASPASRAARACAGAPGGAPSAASRDSTLVADVLEFLRMCQEADDQQALLEQVCARVHERLDLAGIALVGRSPAGPSVLAASGRRVADPDLADRAMALGAPIGPSATASGYEAAAPVRYGGEAVGAVVARWAADRVPDVERGAAMLAAAATATASAVRNVIDQAATRSTDLEQGRTGLVGVSSPMVELRYLLARAAPAPFPVLIQGESGTGKELAARTLHASSPRRGRFCALNCAALGDDLIEAELFGHTRGAFTGAVAERPGLFEAADGGTLFLDEVGELSPRAQAKLLRAIQEGEIRRIGETVSRAVDVRIVAATNRPLQEDVRDGRFRQDLLYRLDVIRVSVPPLRERREDIPILAARFWEEARSRTGSRAVLAPSTMAALSSYGWPGNVRELQNVMSALAVAAPRRGILGASALPGAFGTSSGASASEQDTLESARRRFEEGYVRAALVRAGGRRSRAAADLGLTRQGLAKMLARLGISPPALS